MVKSTQEQFLDAATELFAERGFYGISIANIAGELGLTKQALLHHFGSKEKLYGEVLRRISERLEEGLQEALAVGGDPEEQIVAVLLRICQTTTADVAQTRLLMRELLDNKRRADLAGTWYLKPFLESLTAMVQGVPGWQTATDAQALALVYQLLGAINYFGISTSTLGNMFRGAAFAELSEAFPVQLERLVRVALASPPSR